MFQKKIIVWPMLVFNYPVSSISSALAKTKLYVFLKQWIWPRRWKQSLFGLFHQNPFTPLTPFIKKKKSTAFDLSGISFFVPCGVKFQQQRTMKCLLLVHFTSCQPCRTMRRRPFRLSGVYRFIVWWWDKTKKKKLWRMIKDVKEMVFMQFTIF